MILNFERRSGIEGKILFIYIFEFLFLNFFVGEKERLFV